MSIISERMKKIKPSATLELSQRANELKKSGKQILSLTAGEPDLPTPKWICQDAYKASLSGETKYTSVGGTDAIKSSIIKKYQYSKDVGFENILVSCGAKHSIFNALMSSLNDGDEVIIPAPYWVSYPAMVTLCGGIPKIVECTESNGFKLQPKDLQETISEKTKWVIINTPNNPTGSVYSRQELVDLGKVIENTNCYVMSDEIYEHHTYDTSFTSFYQANPNLVKKTLTISGVSKAYAMTGWRIGYAIGPKVLIKSMEKLQSQSTSNASSISQAASVSALSGPQEFLQERCDIFKNRRNIIVNGLNNIKGITCSTPNGAFYVYACVKGLIGKKTSEGKILLSDKDVSEYFLNKANVAAVPGIAFGLSPYIRFSYATKEDIIHSAIKQIDKATRELS